MVVCGVWVSECVCVCMCVYVCLIIVQHVRHPTMPTMVPSLHQCHCNGSIGGVGFLLDQYIFRGGLTSQAVKCAARGPVPCIAVKCAARGRVPCIRA